MTRRFTPQHDRLSNRQRRRNEMEAMTLGRRAHLAMLAVLTQLGGTVELDPATLDRVNMNYRNLSFSVRPDPETKQVVVQLLEREEPTTGMPAPNAVPGTVVD